LNRLIFSLLACAWLAAGQNAKLEVDPVLFTVMAAINGAGYDTDLDSPNNSPIRKQIREYLAQKKPPSLEGLREIYAARRKPDPARDLSQYISLAMCLEIYPSAEGPDFRYRYRAADLPPDVAELDGIEKLLTRFYKEANLAQILAGNQKLLDGMLEPYGPPVTLAMQEIDAYLRLPRIQSTKGAFHVYLDLLAAPNQIHVRSYGNDFFIVITPSLEPQIEYVRNAYLHYQIDPIALRSLADIETKKSLADFAQGAGALDDQYKNDFALLTVASLAKAVSARLGPAKARAAAVEEFTTEGFILTPYFEEALAVYEKQEQAFRLYLPSMIQGIDPKKETARLDGVAFLAAPKTRRAKVAPAPVVERSPAEKTLEEAEEVYGRKDYAAAGTLFRRALAETNARALKARGYYGLARIAALTRDPETAVELFEKTIAEGAEPQVAAWAHVFLGRLFDLAQDGEGTNLRAKAKANFEAALALPGASPAARKAAEDGLQGVRIARPEPKP
jgi:hypothetical protein